MASAKAPVWPGPQLIVPMTVEALLTGNLDIAAGNTWASTQYNYQSLFQGGVAEPVPFTPATSGPAPGAHVLWTLPYALRNGGTLTDDGQTQFPAAPNRWLVLRIEYPLIPPGAPGTVPQVPAPKLVASVVWSDSLATLPQDPSGVSQYPDPVNMTSLNVFQLGQTSTLADWDGPPGPATPFLRAIGPGTVSWAVTYDNVRNVFSLYDALPEPANGQSIFTYSVVGWYADPGSDPLSSLPTDSAVNWQAMLEQQFNWTVDDVATAESDWSAWQAAYGMDGGTPTVAPPLVDFITGWKKWQTANGAAAAQPPLPTKLLCYGSVMNLVWMGQNQTYGLGAPDVTVAKPAVAIGNTPTECIAAWMAKVVYDEYGYSDPDALLKIELALEAFQKGILNDLETDPVSVEDRLHASDFAGAYGGTEWIVVRPEAQGTPGDHKPVMAGEYGGQQTIPLDAQQTALLTQLNSQQTMLDGLHAQLGSLRWELYAAFLKWVYYAGGDEATLNAICAALSVLQTEITVVLDAISTQKSQVEATSAALQAALGSTGSVAGASTPKFVLKQVALPGYAAPNDPVIMIGGLQQSTKFAAPGTFDAGDQDLLVTRSTGQSIVGLTVSNSGGGAATPVTLTATDLLAAITLPAGNSAGLAIPKEAADLWVETLLLDPSCAPFLTQLYFNRLKVTPTVAQANAVAEAIETQQTQPYGGATALGLDYTTIAAAVGFQGTPPSPPAIEYRPFLAPPPPPFSGTAPGKSRQPWTPIYMDWSVRWFPTSNWDDWSLDEIDYAWNGNAVPAAASAIPFVGRTEINASSSQGVVAKLETFVADDPNFQGLDVFQKTALTQVAAQLKTADIVTQSIAGFTEQLLTRLSAMVPPLEALPADRQCDCSSGQAGSGQPVDAKAIVALLGKTFRTAYQPIYQSDNPPFFPLRAGHLQIQDLWIVDAFGQILRGKNTNLGPNPLPDPIRSTNLIAASPNLSSSQLASFAQLNPRLSQPARVRLRFLSGSDDTIPTNSSDATSPICGWVMANHLDSSLMVFEADGTNKGALINVLGDPTTSNPTGAGVRWDAVAGSDAPLGAPPDLVNPHLQSFVTTLLNRALTDGNVLYDLLGAIDATLWKTDPFGQRYGNLSILLGRPLAIVRADVALQLDGAPAYCQAPAGTGKYYVDTSSGTPVFRPIPVPFQSTRFQLRIGDIEVGNNGVLGYFLNDDYNTFYTAYGSPAGNTNELLRALATRGNVGDALARMASASRALDSNYVVNNFVIPLQPQTAITPPSAANPVPSTGTYTTEKLTVIMDSSGVVGAYSGSLPSVSLALPPGPVTSALSEMDVTFRVGPVLMDPAKIKMPLPAEINGNWAWLARTDVTNWDSGQDIGPADAAANLSTDPLALREGWLTLSGAVKVSKRNTTKS